MHTNSKEDWELISEIKEIKLKKMSYEIYGNSVLMHQKSFDPRLGRNKKKKKKK